MVEISRLKEIVRLYTEMKWHYSEAPDPQKDITAYAEWRKKNRKRMNEYLAAWSYEEILELGGTMDYGRELYQHGGIDSVNEYVLEIARISGEPKASDAKEVLDLQNPTKWINNAAKRFREIHPDADGKPQAIDYLLQKPLDKYLSAVIEALERRAHYGYADCADTNCKG